jgi:hypothetical protein
MLLAMLLLMLLLLMLLMLLAMLLAMLLLMLLLLMLLLLRGINQQTIVASCSTVLSFEVMRWTHNTRARATWI